MERRAYASQAEAERALRTMKGCGHGGVSLLVSIVVLFVFDRRGLAAEPWPSLQNRRLRGVSRSLTLCYSEQAVLARVDNDAGLQRKRKRARSRHPEAAKSKDRSSPEVLSSYLSGNGAESEAVLREAGSR
jgi:hypothetical protein